MFAKFVACRTECLSNYVTTSEVDLMCPSHLSFEGIANRSTFYNTSEQQKQTQKEQPHSQQQEHGSICIICNVEKSNYKVSVCSPHHGVDADKIKQIQFRNFKMCKTTKWSGCDEKDIPKINPSKHCGFKNQHPWPIQNTKYIIYLPCEQVPNFTIMFGRDSFHSFRRFLKNMIILIIIPMIRMNGNTYICIKSSNTNYYLYHK
jgi:hypothetical protein